MAIPRTYLMVAPKDAVDLLGRAMTSDDIIKGLRQINNQIVTNAASPIKAVGATNQMGITCLWLGEPHVGEKITAMRLGTIPEHTQLSPEGVTICKGWRAIFEKVIRARAATRGQIERKFKIDLTIDGDDGLCRTCAVKNQRRAHNGGAAKRCARHDKDGNVQRGRVERLNA